MKRLLTFALVALALVVPQARAGDHAYSWSLPPWMPVPPVPADNPMSDAKVELGRHLFYDKALSADQTIACASCHRQERGFTDGRKTALGIQGIVGHRNSMSLANVAYLPVLTWANPNLTSLEFQALVPIFGEHPVEMGMAGKEQLLLGRLAAKPVYRELFAKAYPSEVAAGGDPVSIRHVLQAVASFQRSLLSVDSPYDRYRYGGDKKALSVSARRGEALFFGERLECYHCHGGLHFTDNLQHARLAYPEKGFHNTGLYNTDGKGGYPRDALGLMEFTGEPLDMGRFRTPSLRNVAVTGPYMHDGSIATLADVIEKHYAIAGRSSGTRQGSNPLRSELIAGFRISPREVHDLVRFLESLTDRAFLKNPRHSDPWVPQKDIQQTTNKQTP